MNAPELIERAMRGLGIEPDGKSSNRELARQLGLVPHDLSQGRQKVARWRSGPNEPEFESTLLLLDAAGLLRDEAGPVSQPQPQQADVAELEALVARLEQVAESLQRLRVQASEEIVTQLARQTELLATLERAAASLPAAQPATPSRRAGKRTA